MGLPDITLIPGLASALGITTDVLFGLTPGGAEEAVAAVREKIRQNPNKTAEIDCWQALLEQHPNHNGIRQYLARAYLRRSSAPTDIAQAAHLLERIAAESTDSRQVKKALYMLPFCYQRLGDTGNAVRCADMLDPFRACQEVILAKGDGYVRKNEINMELFEKCLREGQLCLGRLEEVLPAEQKDTWRVQLEQIRLAFADVREKSFRQNPPTPLTAKSGCDTIQP